MSAKETIIFRKSFVEMSFDTTVILNGCFPYCDPMDSQRDFFSHIPPLHRISDRPRGSSGFHIPIQHCEAPHEDDLLCGGHSRCASPEQPQEAHRPAYYASTSCISLTRSSAKESATNSSKSPCLLIASIASSTCSLKYE